tara:strand:+ start:7924 stop:8322 length:399 start_codon:yes stop_codon:yes gene_type:complete
VVDENATIYKLLLGSNNNFFTQKPEMYLPSVNETHYTQGFISRYFVKPANDKFASITEVTEIEFLSFASNPFYKRVSFKWKITGPINRVEVGGIVEEEGVGEFNFNQLKNAEGFVEGISEKLSDLYQFYKAD